MRHLLATNKRFGRTSEQRKALFRNLSISLIEHEQIFTTLAKAKTLRGFVEPLITLAKNETLANRRLVLSRLGNNKKATHKLFTDLGKHYQKRPGGYVRVLKAGFRTGDKAPMALVQLVDRQSQ